MAAPRPTDAPPAGYFWFYDRYEDVWYLEKNENYRYERELDESGKPTGPENDPRKGYYWTKVPGTQGAYVEVPLGQTFEQTQEVPVYTPKKYYDWSPRDTSPPAPAAEPPYAGNVPLPTPARPYLPVASRRPRQRGAWNWRPRF